MGSVEIKLGRIFSEIYEEGPDGVPEFRAFVDGSWTRSSDGTTFDLRTPIDGSAIARVQRCNESDLERAVRAAKENQKKIRSLAAIDRIEIMEEVARIIRNHTDDFAMTITLEMGRANFGVAGRGEGDSGEAEAGDGGLAEGQRRVHTR
jgi:hypothetical protein